MRSLGWTRVLVIIVFSAIAPLTLSVIASTRSVTASSPVLTENFGNNTFNQSVWQAETVGTGPIVQVANQSLVVTLPPNSADNPARSVFGGALVSTCRIQGDFDMQVGFQLQTWPSYNGVRTGIGNIFQLYGTGSPYSDHYAVERDSFAFTSDYPYNQSYVTDLLDGVQGFIRANDSSGMLRITRIGSTATGYYSNSGSWAIIHTGPMSSGEVGFSLGVWSHNYAFAHQTVKVAFENFILNSGQLVCPSLVVNPSSGPVGTKVQVTGTGFPVSFSPFVGSSVRVSFDDQFLGTTTDENGAFSFTFNVPVAQAGMHEVKVVDTATATNATTNYQVTISPGSLGVSLTVGTIYFPGDTVVASILVTFGGTPVGSNSLQVQVNLTRPNDSKMALNASSVGSGLFRATYLLPRTAAIGTYALVATVHDPTIGSGTSLATFEVKLPWLSSQGQTITVGTLASVAIIGAAIFSWKKGYFRRSSLPESAL